ncbi:MAG: hypothetical protein M1833_001150 [Piccolia ochrophora]|nr:MAG: hypothetical protein M1833_001150 [Piccolia ochrophora]
MKRDLLPSNAFPAWAHFNDVKYNGVVVKDFGPPPDGKGFAVVAERDIEALKTDILKDPLMFVPKDLILSLESVNDHAKSDKHLRELLDAAGDIARTSRGAILLYLLLQITASSPNRLQKVGVSGPWTDSSSHDLDSGRAESVEWYFLGAVSAKLSRMTREFDHIRASTEPIPWCQAVWWDDTGCVLTLDEWLLVDAWYRSRALSFAVAGDAMVACIDMANHAPGEQTSVYFDRDEEGNAILLLPHNRSFNGGDEVTISYGDAKSASETLFSYGFIDPDMRATSGMTLDLEVPEDDPLKEAKDAVSTVEAAVRISATADSTKWDSLYIWIACVNEEDGLQFHVLQTTDGARELRVYWKENDITEDSGRLPDLLRNEESWEIFQLRAVAILEARLAEQSRRLANSEDWAQGLEVANGISYGAWIHATRLRRLENDLLERAAHDLESEKEELLKTSTVQRYLGLAAQAGSSR